MRTTCRLPFTAGALTLLLLLTCAAQQAAAAEVPDDAPKKRIAAIVTAYYHNSHADVIVSRLLQTDTLDGKGREPRLKLTSLYTDQVPSHDISRKLSAEYGFPIVKNVREALTLGGDKLAVDGILLVCEHGDYPKSATGSIIYPKRRLFDEIVKVFEETGETVPIFSDKHLADNWKDAKHIYDTAQRLGFPMMAGSSLPVLWRKPAADVQHGAKLKEVVALSYHTLDGYGFHALEMLQAIVEQRAGGESGIKSVRTLEGDAAWQAIEKDVDQELLQACIGRLTHPSYNGTNLRKRVKKPVVWQVFYADGLKASVITLNGAVAEWPIAWREEGSNKVQSTLFWTQEERPYHHFAHLLAGVEKMMHSGQAAWPVERTLMTSGLLDALLISQHQGGKLLQTPQLMFSYDPQWRWKEPPPPPPGRPYNEQ